MADLLESGEIDDIEANLNFDMLSSPNFVRFVYDGDNANSTGGAEGPPGSAEIEQVFLDYFESQELATDPTPFNGRSDYGPFIAPAAYVPAGGLFSGAEGVKTDAAGRDLRRCGRLLVRPVLPPGLRHVQHDRLLAAADAPGLQDGEQAADAALMRGNGPIGLGQLADGAAHATWTLARSQSPIVGPAEARVARVASNRSSYARAFRRAARKQEYKGGQLIR